MSFPVKRSDLKSAGNEQYRGPVCYPIRQKRWLVRSHDLCDWARGGRTGHCCPLDAARPEQGWVCRQVWLRECSGSRVLRHIPRPHPHGPLSGRLGMAALPHVQIKDALSVAPGGPRRVLPQATPRRTRGPSSLPG